MRLLDKPIDSITAEDIRDLVYTRKLPESRTLDYKQELPSDKDNKKMEFLKDVAALANSSGGVLIFGVAEEKDEDGQNTGFPKELIELVGFKPDPDIRRLDQIIMDGIQPRLKVDFEAIEVDGKWVLLLAVPRSLFAPHIIWFNKSGKFYARGNAGNYQMDVHQIRDGFLRADSWEKTADNFRRMRLMDIQTGKVGLLRTLEEGLFIHIVPLGHSELRVDYKTHQDSLMRLKPSHAVNLRTGFNSDGFFVAYDGPSFYAQYFRNGAVEFFTDEMFQSWTSPTTTISGDGLERYVVKRLIDYISYAPNLDILPPYGVYLTLFGVQGTQLIGVNPTPNEPYHNPFGEFLEDSELFLPSVFIEDLGDDLVTTLSTTLRPVFDVLWQASGRAESPNYKDGSWRLLV